MTIEERLAKIVNFEVKPDFSSLTSEEKEALKNCVKASAIMNDIYLQQFYKGNSHIISDLLEKTTQKNDAVAKNLLAYFFIQGSPWDSYNHDEPFIEGVGPKPKFGSFYPEDLTKEEWASWLTAHPEDKEQFESHYTTIRRTGNGLCSVPYSLEYADYLQEAADKLRQASSHLSEGKLRTFLEMRAESFISNEYFDSDVAWISTNGIPFEVTMGPYETYFDKLLGLKSSFESFVAMPDKDATNALSKFSPVVPEFDKMLSEEFDYSPKGTAIPLEVVSDVHRGGEAGFGYMFVAYNLPNERKIHDLYGSKKVFSRTMMEAKFKMLGSPIAERILSNKLLDDYVFNNRLLFVLAHEFCHGLGPSYSIAPGYQTPFPFEIMLKDLHSCIEEAKADMLGARLLNFFREKGLIDSKTLASIITSEIVAYVQSWKHGFTEDHARGHLVEFNWLMDSGGLKIDGDMIHINPEVCLDAMICLSTELIKLQVAGNYDSAKAFLEHWGLPPISLAPILAKISDTPTAVKPLWDLSGL